MRKTKPAAADMWPSSTGVTQDEMTSTGLWKSLLFCQILAACMCPEVPFSAHGAHQPSCQQEPPSPGTLLSLNLLVAGPTKSQRDAELVLQHCLGASGPGTLARSLPSHWRWFCSPKPNHSQLHPPLPSARDRR